MAISKVNLVLCGEVRLHPTHTPWLRACSCLQYSADHTPHFHLFMMIMMMMMMIDDDSDGGVVVNDENDKG